MIILLGNIGVPLSPYAFLPALIVASMMIIVTKIDIVFSGKNHALRTSIILR
ncbi:hypothetical protein DSBG_4508 [Desulfosporosinus sp. BG]|nr:hypothetical protein DSBG_4508 [Desulfosporosinus sp. BG]